MTNIKDDFYEAVNQDWLETAEIPSDKPATGGFQDIAENIEQLLIKQLNEMSTDESKIPEGKMKEAVAFYRLANDYDKRNSLKSEPIQDLLDRIHAIDSYQDLNQQLASWIKDGLPLPFEFFVDADMKDTQKHALYLGPTALILPDKTYYDSEQGEKLLQVFFDMVVELLNLTGCSQSESETIAEQALAFDRSLVPYVRTAEENADYTKIYNPRDRETVTTYSDQIDFTQAFDQLFDDTVDQIIITEPEYFENFNTFITDGHLPLLKSWMFALTVVGYARYLSEDFRQAASQYRRALSGIENIPSQEKAAFHLTLNQFDQIIGLYYGKNYFGEKAKQDVEHMVHSMIAIYKDRLKQNDWLGEATKEKAILKLDNIGINVGYPDKIPAVYNQLVTNKEDSLVANVRNFSKLARLANFKKFKKPVDRNEWEMAASTVNAYYNGSLNIIVFPAAILQAPFYSLEQSASANYGGIGAVIAHEISHAFDNNGAKFDEYGNMNNWWTKEDLASFEKLAQEMIKEFDGLQFAEGTVNGTLTVSENIADAGGLSCALEAAKKEDQNNLEAFFYNWAKIWRTKAKQQYQQLLLAIDVHAPAKLRANIQLQNLDDFFTVFDIQSTDGMYRKTENRVKIW
ncbi:M13 family metallopeptidase [Tetragenococcus halophilus]|uniref:Endopeptidase O n=1 Tax=Tetragenococcus halophilus (strain DSM 20338 / JCM 20259 / NCIMB 9735 / NBRC 12172) TaxID=945021 RepID=A0AAN1SID3_TETHN|nr:M13 family metallopeptidase [Tetragenococcus halophilus]NWO00997.1 M13 family metallopeptidase [Tetragenococcus halophilus]QXN86571.1 M13 family metallopeptidase [Tetragenococcus halophilus]RQD29506.1 peptidase M13 [Tetragenococcus halophilus subsp. halophilus DSM 20339]WJS81637.1 M13 family metallopeptidase [Tetragenococcus halophilus]BAK95467.1 endopeptidase O [Tetragenococcus halophilus NBRC 12172]